MSKYRDHDAEKLQERQWANIRSEWMNYVPDHASPWPLPDHEVYELPTLEERLKNLGGPRKNDSIFEDEIEGLRKAVMHEAVILIHKAANVLRVAALEGERGYRTWCRSSAYHAAFFAMKGVLAVLGVFVFRGRDRQAEYQVDLWAPRLQKQRSFGPTASRFAVRIIRRTHVEHKEMWGIFSRVLRVTTIDSNIWPLLSQDPLRHLEPGEFSSIRHEIHYRSAGWLFADLDSLKDVDDFSKLADEASQLKNLDKPSGTDFLPALALHIFSLGVALLQDLGKEIPEINAEVARLQKWMLDSPWKQVNAFILIEGTKSK